MRFLPFLALMGFATSMPAQQSGMIDGAPRAVVLGTGSSAPSAVSAPPIAPPEERTATFFVNYSGFTPEAEAAFQFAVDIWSGLITSNVPIVIDATWEDLPGNTLGSAGANGLFWNFSGAPQTNVLYPSPLANKLAGFDLDPGNADMSASFDSGTNWYLGLDGNTPFSQYDLVSVVMHEIGHGLGFSGTAYVGDDLNGYILNDPLAIIYDAYVWTGNNEPILDIGSGTAALADALTSNNLYWAGVQGNANSGAFSPKMYAPANWEPGSSFSHFDEATYPAGDPHSLMTPQIGNGESVHSPGAMCLGVLDDIGWTVDYAALEGGGQGCTDPEACNYDSEATINDGSCTYPVAGEPCGDCMSVWSMAASLASGNGEVFEFDGIGGITTLEVAVQWAGSSGGGEWVSDLLVVLCDPEGQCVQWGGYDMTANEADAGVDWPTSWNTGTAGTYTATFDLTALNLAGLGTWTVALYNGYTASTGLNLTDVTFTLPGLCPFAGLDPGCTDEAACNYDPTADYNDGSCDYLCFTCTATLIAETFQSYGTGTPLTVQSDAGWETWSGISGTNEDPYVVFDGADGAAALASPEADPGQANDLYLPIDVTEGTHVVQFAIRREAGQVAYYNFQGNVEPGLEWTLEVFMGLDGTMTFIQGGDTTAVAGGFTAGEDHFITHLFDLDANELRIVLGSSLVALLDYNGNLGGVNFFPYSFGGGIGYYLLDDVTVCATSTLLAGCTDAEACNFDPAALVDDGSCWTPFDYGWCDCGGSVFDALGDCGGECAADVDDDGICDDVDDCVGGEPDECGVCDGPGAIYECGCTDIPAGDCDCFGNQWDALGVCGGDCDADLDGDGVCDVPGCMDPEACNYDAGANYDDGSCQYAAQYYDCAGNCLNDADGDGVCDELEVSGCTDEEACNFEEDATEEDGTCAYLVTEGIDGNETVTVGDVQLYVATPSDPGNSYTWAVTGGDLVSGQGTGIVTVEWTTVGGQGLQVVETNAVCNGQVVGLDVEVEAVVGVEEAGPSALSPFPNPARDGFRLSAGRDVRLFDLGGALVRQWNAPDADGWYTLDGVAPGCYLLMSTTSSGRRAERLIVWP